MLFLNPQPDRAYVSNNLWLPKCFVKVPAIKGSLEFWTRGMDAEMLQLWRETKDHLIVPREFIPPHTYNQWPFEYVDVTPKNFERVDFTTNIRPRDDAQREAMAAMLDSDGGILNLACGRGKTVVALWLLAQLKVPALIVVNNTTLISQWQERIDEHLSFTGRVGRVQGDIFDWKHPIVLSMIHTLALHADQWPPDFRRHFGVVIYDEIHHLAAPLFSLTAPLFYGLRYGLTATHEREDGRENIYYVNVGRVFYSDLYQELTPRVYFHRLPTELNITNEAVREQVIDRVGQINLSMLRVWLGQQENRNERIAEEIRKMRSKGRKVLALTHSIAHLEQMRNLFPEAAIVWGGVNQVERYEILRSNDLIFATAPLAYEGLDEPSLDTLVLMTPFGSANWVQQSIGRIQRTYCGKMAPVVTIFEDFRIDKCKSVCLKAKRSLRKLGLNYQIVR